MADAVITWISGPVLRARTSRELRIAEAIVVGTDRLLGEVIRVDGDDVVAQIYEDTTGLRPGDELQATGQRLSIRLRPGLLGNIFDGLLRPLAHMPGDTILPGIREAPPQLFSFEPSRQPGEAISAGAAVGTVTSGSMPEPVLVPPDADGTIVSIVEAGNYADDAILCVLGDDAGGEHRVTAGQLWPVRRPRPVRRRLPHDEPLVTGQATRWLKCSTSFPSSRIRATPGRCSSAP
jgi:V/A-type H+-transporting ATPase subunit A